MNTPVSNRVENVVFKLLREAVPWQFSKKSIQPQLSLQNDLGIDSMGKMAVAFRIEQELGLDLSGSIAKMGEIQTVEDVVKLIHQLMVESGKM